MKLLFIGGTGTISTACSQRALDLGHELWHLNRGQRPTELEGVQKITCNIRDPESVRSSTLGEHTWDAVVQFIAFTPDEIERDLELFRGKCGQYVFISSASAYAKPMSHPVVTESTALRNPYWQYSRNKIACEERLQRAHREEAFPMTIVRPSFTYDAFVPLAVGASHRLTVIERMRAGKPVVVHGDGTSLWVMTHSEDFARGFVPLLGHASAVGEAFHIVSDEVLTWNQICRTVARVVGAPEPTIIHIPSDWLAAYDPDRFEGTLLGDKGESVLFDLSKLRRLVPDYWPQVPFHVGVGKALKKMEARGATADPEEDAYFDALIEAYLKGFPARKK